MKKYLKLLAINLVLILFLFSCEDTKNIRYYSLNVELNEPISNLKESDPLPEYLKAFVNYTDTSVSSELLVPDVTFVRTDIKTANMFKLEPPLTWINKFRKGRNMLPSAYLKEDYDKLISELVSPIILTEAKGKADISGSASAEYGDNTFLLNINKVKPDSVKMVQERILRKLISSKGNTAITLRIIDKAVDQAQDLIHPVKKDSIVDNQDTTKQIKKPMVTDDGKKPQTAQVNKPVTQKYTANSFDEYLKKIGDQSIPGSAKESLISAFIERYFEGENSMVVVIEKNGTESQHRKIREFVDDISVRNFKFQVSEKKTNNDQKITLLKIKEYE